MDCTTAPEREHRHHANNLLAYKLLLQRNNRSSQGGREDVARNQRQRGLQPIRASSIQSLLWLTCCYANRPQLDYGGTRARRAFYGPHGHSQVILFL